MKKALFLLGADSFQQIYGAEQAAEIGRLVEISPAPLLRDVEIILSGWGAPVMDEAFLDAAPRLEAVFYGAGSVRGLVSDAFWDRGFVLSSAWAMNAVPVAEFTLAQILLALKRTWPHALSIVRGGLEGRKRLPVPGAYGATVGIISLGAVGRKVCELLKPFDLQVLAYDPFVDDAVLAELSVQRAGLDELFERSDVVSLHAPNLPSTRGMITGAHFERMKPDATFINTARGDVIREREMADVLRRRPDLWAILDVLANNDRGETPDIYELPNVVITPHIAGSMGRECRRMGKAVADELRRYLAGEPLRWPITRERLAVMA